MKNKTLTREGKGGVRHRKKRERKREREKGKERERLIVDVH
jgi:hypothetical protein